MPDNIENVHGRINDMQDRLTNVEMGSIERNGKLDKRLERVTANMEEIGRNVSRLEKSCAGNTERQAALQQMHGELLREQKFMCASIDKAKDIAVAARTIAEDAQIAAAPAILDHKKRNEGKRDWRKLFFNVLAGLATAAAMVALGWLAAHVPNG